MPDSVTLLEQAMLDRDAAPHAWHFGELDVFDQSGLDLELLAGHIAERIAYIPRFRMRPTFSTTRVWADDPGFEVPAHLRLLKLPQRATLSQVQVQLQELLHEPLCRDHPRWQIAVLSQLSNHRSAIITRTHPALVNQTGVHLLQELFDDRPRPIAPEAVPWTPQPVPSPLAAFRQGLLGVLRHDQPPLKQASLVASRMGAAVGKLSAAGIYEVNKTIGQLAADNEPVLHHVGGTTLNAEVLKAVQSKAGCSRHDVILAVIAGGLRRVGERRDSIVLAPIPVVRRDQATGFGLEPVLMSLPVQEDSPSQRVAAIMSLTQISQATREIACDDHLQTLPGFLPATMHTSALQLGLGRVHEILISDVVGPSTPRFLGSRQLKASYPFLPLTGQQRISVGLTHYCDACYVGLAGVEPVADLATAMNDELHELATEGGFR